jgi:hypothetical protein
MKAIKIAWLTSVAALSLAAAGAARADDTPPAAAAAAPAGPTALSTPAMSASLSSNADPLNMDWGPLGKIYLSGQVSAFGMSQTAAPAASQKRKGDISNLQLEIQKTDGVVQFYVQAGEYNFPSLGTPVATTNRLTEDTYKYVPVAYLKLQPTAEWSVLIGKLPTLIGAEYNFTFENMNIERGLLWNQENLVNRGIQANYSHGPLAVSVSLNDGFYSNNLSWVTGSATWTFNPANILAFAAGGNYRTVNTSNSATPLLQNNSQIYNLIYTHTQGPWTLVPYLQYTQTAAIPQLGIGTGGTFGGALFASYAVPADAKLGGVPLAGLSLPFRFEYITSRGNTVNLLYGPGSNAWSLTFSPTYQFQIYYIRAEVSYVDSSSTTSGFGFGANGNGQSQTRGLIEIGTVF